MTWSHRKRFLTAIDLKEPDMVPITDLGLDPPVVEAIIGKKLGGFSLVAGSGKDPWAVSVRSRIAVSEACLKLGFDAVPAISDYSMCSKNYKPKMISENRFIDEWGRLMESRADTKTTWWISGVVETEDAMNSYEPPDPEREGLFEMVEQVVKPLKDKDAVIIGQGHGGWHMAFQVRGGIDKLLIDMYMRPKITLRFMEKIAKACLGLIKLMIDGGVEVIFLTDDYADCKSPFMNLKQFREFELPNIGQAVAYAKSRGVPVLKHSDGNIYP
ncbi:MAG: uroporphyrinogen decarboxylase family protein, partial [Candidatus Bathyarchaeia archaeon]